MNTPVLDPRVLWHDFIVHNQLTDTQGALFKHYATLLQEWAPRINLTTLTSDYDIVMYHFADSLAVCRKVAMNQYFSLADVGTGAGFPGIPLKIVFPEKRVYLLEVNQKKIVFLYRIIDALGLTGIEVIDLDWRTFLRKTSYSIDLFCARASLAPAELLRMFQPSSAYQRSELMYWASKQWRADKVEQPFVHASYTYQVGNKERVLVHFRNS